MHIDWMIDLYLYSVKNGFVLNFCFKSSKFIKGSDKAFQDPNSHGKNWKTLLTKNNQFTKFSKDITLCLMEA